MIYLPFPKISDQFLDGSIILNIMNERKEQIQDIYDQLLTKANEDGIITNEEQAILDQVEMGVNKYHKMLDNALKDEVINENERYQLQNIRSKMLGDSWVKADEDSVISRDEAVLLNLLLKLMKNID